MDKFIYSEVIMAHKQLVTAGYSCSNHCIFLMHIPSQWLLCTRRLSTRRPCSITLCCLPLCSWVVVVLKWFDFAIDRETSSREKDKFINCWKLQQCHPVTIPHLCIQSRFLVWTHQLIEALLCGVCLFFPCLCGQFLAALTYPHSPQACMLCLLVILNWL